MPPTRDEVLAAVRRDFPADWRRSLDLLDTYGSAIHERERERVQLAILEIARGNSEKLKDALALAKKDYRDVLVWAYEPQEPGALKQLTKKVLELLLRWSR